MLSFAQARCVFLIPGGSQNQKQITESVVINDDRAQITNQKNHRVRSHCGTGIEAILSVSRALLRIS